MADVNAHYTCATRDALTCNGALWHELFTRRNLCTENLNSAHKTNLIRIFAASLLSITQLPSPKLYLFEGDREQYFLVYVMMFPLLHDLNF